MAKVERSVAGATLGLVLAALSVAPAAPADSAHPFERYLGEWRGAGKIETVKGDAYTLACSATCEESEGGKALAQSICCDSKKYKFAIENYIVASGDQVVGSWRELTMQVQGNVTGEISGVDVHRQGCGAGGDGDDLDAGGQTLASGENRSAGRRHLQGRNCAEALSALAPTGAPGRPCNDSARQKASPKTAEARFAAFVRARAALFLSQFGNIVAELQQYAVPDGI